jgi:trimeric autotransporter adhesin
MAARGQDCCGGASDSPQCAVELICSGCALSVFSYGASGVTLTDGNVSSPGGGQYSGTELQIDTTFMDAGHLTVAIPASDLANAGSATITVANPGAVASGPLTFTIN